MTFDPENYGMGRLPLPLDPRDLGVQPVLQAETAKAETRTRRLWTMGGPPTPIILNQGNTGTCEGNAWTNVLIAGPFKHPEIAALQAADTAEEYARQLYLDATGDATLDQGAYTRQILSELLRRELIASYHRCASVDEIVNTVLYVGPVGFGCNWYRSMDRPVDQFGNSYLYVDESSGIRGGHETCFTAVDLAPEAGPPYLRMENSWGTGFAHGGTVRVPLTEAHKLYVGDAYTVTERVAP